MKGGGFDEVYDRSVKPFPETQYLDSDITCKKCRLVAWIITLQILKVSNLNHKKCRSLATTWKIGQRAICNGDHTYSQTFDMRIIS